MSYFIQIKGDIKNHPEITIVICIDNDAFYGAKFAALIDEINQACLSTSCKLKKVNIVDTSYLNRLYDEKYNDPSTSQWKEQHSKILEKLVIEHEYINWDKYLSNPLYIQNYAPEAQKDYDTNRDGFKTMADTFSEKFAYKSGKEAALSYFLEESAAFRLKKGVILYPGNLKDPFRWVMDHYQTNVTIMPYVVKEVKKIHQKSVEVIKKDQSDKNMKTCNYEPTIFGGVAPAMVARVDRQIKDEDRRIAFLLDIGAVCDRYYNRNGENKELPNNSSMNFKLN